MVDIMGMMKRAQELQGKMAELQEKLGDVLVEALDLPGAVGRLLDLIRRSRAVESPRGKGITATESGAIMKAIKLQRRELDDVEAAVVAATEDGGAQVEARPTPEISRES